MGWQVERSNTASSLGERVSNHHPPTETATEKANKKISYIEDLIVDENYSHKGIKDKLTGLAIYKSHKKKCNQIFILSNDENTEYLNNKGFEEEKIKIFTFTLE